MLNRTLFVVSAVAAAGLTLAPAPVGAEGESKRFSIHPSVRVAAVADDNVDFEKHDKQGDVGFWANPRLELGYRTRSLELGADVGADVRRYIRHSRLGDEFYQVHAFAELGLLPGLTMRVSDTYVPQPEQLGLPEDEGPNLTQTNRAAAKVAYWRELPAGREIEVGVQGTHFMVDGLTGDNEYGGDHWETSAYAELTSPVFRRITAFARSQFRYRIFDSDGLDNLGVTGIVGFRTSLLRDLELALSGGYGLIDFRSRGSQSRVLGEGALRWRMARGWSASLTGYHRFTADVTGQEFTETTGRFTVERRFNERTAATVGAFVTQFEGENGNRDPDLFGGVEAGLRRQLTRRIQLGLNYRHWRNAGDESLNDFRQNRVMLVLSYRR